jgi:hypothetical protein
MSNPGLEYESFKKHGYFVREVEGNVVLVVNKTAAENILNSLESWRGEGFAKDAYYISLTGEPDEPTHDTSSDS